MANTKIGIIGGGSWATALIKVLNENNHAVTWWLRRKEVVEHLSQYHYNPNYLSSVTFNPSLIHATTDLSEAFQNEIILLAVPSAFLKNTLQNFSVEQFKRKTIISAVKGMIAEDNLVIADYLKTYFKVPYEKTVVISGPCHAEEVALEKLSYITLASGDVSTAKSICKLFECRFLHCTPSEDILGTEYAAVLKNIYAIASGICHGLGYGDNFQAVLISNAIEEMERFTKSVYPITRDIKDSAYLGDLLVTAYSQFSRNRALGTMIGKGYSVKAALLEMNMIAEGYFSSRCVFEVNRKHKVTMPIADSVYKILYEQKEARSVIAELCNHLS